MEQEQTEEIVNPDEQIQESIGEAAVNAEANVDHDDEVGLVDPQLDDVEKAESMAYASDELRTKAAQARGVYSQYAEMPKKEEFVSNNSGEPVGEEPSLLRPFARRKFGKASKEKQANEVDARREWFEQRRQIIDEDMDQSREASKDFDRLHDPRELLTAQSL
jgi:hypothetical protein